jgi:RNA polymerase sigma factor (sigma-70 family)
MLVADEDERTAPAEHASKPVPSATGFAEFYCTEYRNFIRMLMAMGATLEDAQDTISEVMKEILEKGLWPGLVSPKAWTRRAILHRFYDQQERVRRRHHLEVRGVHTAPKGIDDEELHIWEDWQWVRQMLDTLPPAQRAVMEAVMAELDTATIGELLGKTDEAVRQNLCQARKKLKASLASERASQPVSAVRKEEASGLE